MKKLLVSHIVLGLSLGAVTASAQATKQNASQLVGSDTLITVINNAINLINTDADPSNDIIGLTYDGLGSSAGQRQLEGNVNRSGEPTCLGTAGSANPGCQQISPMSRPLNNGICDDLTAGPELAGKAEGLAICADAIAVLASNASYQSAATAGSSCTALTDTPTSIDLATGLLSTTLTSNEIGGSAVLPSGYQIGGNSMPAWRDVLRLVYTGCENNQDCTTTAGLAGRKDRCGVGTPARAELITNWYAMFNATNCNTGLCSGGLRAAYRRDDNSGTTNVFLEHLQVLSNLTTRATYRTALGTACQVAINDSHSFCDGGQLEGFWSNALTGAIEHADPVTQPCDAADDLCGRDGRLGVVRAIRSVDQLMATDTAYPPRQCTRNVFKQVPFDSTSCKVCPDGSTPQAGTCFMPVDTSQGTNNFNCINSRVSRPPGASSSFDGRIYNWIVRNGVTGTPNFLATANPDVAQWRQNYAAISTGAGIGLNGGALPQPFICDEQQATSQIACLTANSNCTIGFSGIEAATNPDYDQLNEPLLAGGVKPLDAGYPIARKLYINSIGGFENTSAECATDMTPTSSNFCNSQVRLVNWFHNPANAAAACLSAGFAPLASPVCEGSATVAGCGAPAVQSLSECTAL